VAGRLVGGRAVKVPNAKLSDVGDLLFHGGSFRAKTTIAIDPDVLGLDLVTLGKVKVGFQEFVVIDLESWAHCN